MCSWVTVGHSRSSPKWTIYYIIAEQVIRPRKAKSSLAPIPWFPASASFSLTDRVPLPYSLVLLRNHNTSPNWISFLGFFRICFLQWHRVFCSDLVMLGSHRVWWEKKRFTFLRARADGHFVVLSSRCEKHWRKLYPPSELVYRSWWVWGEVHSAVFGHTDEFVHIESRACSNCHRRCEG